MQNMLATFVMASAWWWITWHLITEPGHVFVSKVLINQSQYRTLWYPHIIHDFFQSVISVNTPLCCVGR